MRVSRDVATRTRVARKILGGTSLELCCHLAGLAFLSREAAKKTPLGSLARTPIASVCRIPDQGKHAVVILAGGAAMIGIQLARTELGARRATGSATVFAATIQHAPISTF
jgi:hypothetical protein